MKRYLWIILWTVLSQTLATAATCPTDSVIGRDQNGKPVSKTLYTYDSIGHTLCQETWKINSDSVLIGNYKTTNDYYSNGKLKSTANWTWSTMTNNWMGTERQDYTYNSAGKVLTKSIYSWSTAKNNWTNSNKYEYQYDSQNRQILYITYSGSDTTWIPTTKMENAYNADGNKTLERYWSSYNTTTKQWVGDHQYFYAYSGKNQTLAEKYTWSSNEWVGQSKVEYGYNTAGKQTSYITYSWDAIAKVFITSKKYRYEYDKWSNLIFSEQYEYISGTWTGIYKSRAEYTGKNSDPIMQATFTWDATNSVFIGVDSIRTTFRSEDFQTLDERYKWDKTLNTWVGVSKWSQNYLPYYRLVYTWNKSTLQWMNQDSIRQIYDNNKNYLLDEQYKWNDTIHAWIGIKKEVNQYTNNKLTNQVTHTWSSNHWIGADSTIHAYTGNNITLEEKYTWDDTKNLWVGISKERYTFNSKGQTTLTIHYTWQDNRTWQGTDSILANYDSGNHQILDEQYTYDFTNHIWIGNTKKEYTYNAKNQMTMHAYYVWEATKVAWRGTEKEEKELDTEGRVAMTASYQWNSTSAQWEGIDKKKIEYTYTPTGKVASQIVYTWKSGAWAWYTKTENTYDANDRKVAYLITSWYSTPQEWVNLRLYGYVYNEAGQTIRDSNFVWLNSEWQLEKRNIHSYDGSRPTLTMSETWKDGVQVSGTKTEQNYGSYGKTDSLVSTYIAPNWELISRTTCIYSATGKLTDKTTLVKDMATSQWAKTYQDTISYDTQDRIILEQRRQYTDGVQTSGTQIESSYLNDETIQTTSNWKNDHWEQSTRIGYTYTSSKKIASITHYRWTGTIWQPDTKTEYEYSGSKNKVTAEYQYNTPSGAWVGISKIGYYYNEYEDLTTATWEWNATSSSWSAKEKLGESYYDNGKLKSKTTYTISGANFVYKERYEYEYGSGAKDITTAKYNWTGTVWKGISKSGDVYTGGNLTSHTTYTWVQNFEWIYNQKTDYEYGSGKDKSTAIYQWKDSVWVGVSKIANTYTSDGKPAGIYTYCWKNNTWADSLKTEYTYDDHGNTIYYIQAKSVNGTWSNLATSTWWEITYDAKDSVVVDAHYTWNTKKNKWYGVSKMLYTYDANGNIITQESDQWDGSGWVGKTKSVKQYNRANKQTLSEIWSWNSTKNKWAGTSKREYGYYHDTIQNMTAIYSWNTTKWDWKGTSKSETLYDEFGNQIAFCQYSWSNSLWKWIGLYKYETIYDAKGRVIEQTTSRYNTDWYYDTKTTYTYDDKHGQIEKKEYTFYNNDLVLTYHSLDTYDQDVNGKLRTELEASWQTTGEILSYERATYYYTCDEKIAITANASPAEGGTVTGGGYYPLDNQVTLTATPAQGCYTFTRWSDGVTTPTRTITVSGEATYTAEFAPVVHQIHVKAKSGGTVAVSIK